MNPATEIRKLNPSNVRELVHILEDADSWKRLMELIPKRLDKENYECNYSDSNPPKYNTEHFKLIERASINYRRPCSEILLDEWGTSGRVRPALGHLLHLLKRAEVFRAADFVALTLLKVEKPKRPKDGPAASVHVKFLIEDDEDTSEESTVSSSNVDTMENNIEQNVPVPRKQVLLHRPFTEEVSDMMKFSRSKEENDDVSESCELNDSTPFVNNLPNITELLEQENNANSQGESTVNVPNISALLESKSSHLPQFSQLLSENQTSEGDCVPQLSQLLLVSCLLHETELPLLSKLLQEPTNGEIPSLSNCELPLISSLLSNGENDGDTSKLLQEISALYKSISNKQAIEEVTGGTESTDSLISRRVREILLSKRLGQYALAQDYSFSAEDLSTEIVKLLRKVDSVEQELKTNAHDSSGKSSPVFSKLLKRIEEIVEQETSSIPLISQLLNSKHYSKESGNNIAQSEGEFVPSLSILLNSGTKPLLESDDGGSELNEHEVCEMPALSELLQANEGSEFVPEISSLSSRKECLNTSVKVINTNEPPRINVFESKIQSIDSLPPQMNGIIESTTPDVSINGGGSIPQVSVSSSIQAAFLLAPGQTESANTSDISSLNTNSSNRPQCNSPLPNLSLNTILPHYNYYELESATDNFDETAHPKGRFLGSGAFGSVFLCLGLTERPTAVKKLHLDGATEVNVNDTITKQFRNEVELLCSYKHDNLLSICGYSCDGPTYCIIYEYISGGALNYRLENNKEELNWRDRLRIACGTAEAVAYLHTAYSRQLIHRDIKTANILLDSANKPKLGDFGIIKLSANKNTTVTTTIIGTSVYMAPESFRSGEVTEKTDTFSFGVVLLELLTALPPLDEKRDSPDLITHVGEMCDGDSIGPLLDASAGTWTKGEMSVAEELFRIANLCLAEKKHRPNMVKVRDLLNDLNF